MKRIHLTREGYEKMVEELEYLKGEKRREISKAIEHARSLGDIKENAEYHAAKEAMSKNEMRVNLLEDKLSRAEIIDDTAVSKEGAFLGAKLTIKDLDRDEEFEYTLVSEDEADPIEGLISISSPVGKALLGHNENDTIKIDVPAGSLNYKIIKISR